MAGRFARWRSDVADELRWMFSAPYEVPKLVAFNIVLVVVLWAVGRQFGLVAHPALVLLPAAIANWAFSDVPATNLYGARPQAALEVLDDREGLRRLISARNGALWLMVAPATALLSAGLGSVDHELSTAILIGLLVLVMPLGFLGLGAISAPIWPYHPLPWRERLARRDTWVRWVCGACSPYVLVGPASFLMLLPGRAMWNDGERTLGMLALVYLVVATWSLLLRRLGISAALGITGRRREWLREFLADPTRG